MNLKEYQKVRDLNPREIKQAIDDFKNATPILRSGEKEEWSAKVGDVIKNRKNLDFKEFYEDVVGRELTPSEIKNKIVDFLEPHMFIDLIYPIWCDSDEKCIEAIKRGELYWLFYLETFEVTNDEGYEVNIGDVYAKFDTIKGDSYIVKSLHALKHNSKSQILSKQDKDFIHVYNDFMNGKIK